MINRQQLDAAIKRTQELGQGRRDTISLCGVHGVGKTTTFERLKIRYDRKPWVRCFEERLNKVCKFPFGSSNQQIAFRSQLYYQQQMGQRNSKIVEFFERAPKRVNALSICDRSPISVLVYSRALGLPDEDYELLHDHYAHSILWVPEILIYYEASVDEIMGRVTSRLTLDEQRQDWNEDDEEYARAVQQAYEQVFEETPFGHNSERLHRVDTNNKSIEEVYEETLQLIDHISPNAGEFPGPGQQQTTIDDWLRAD